MYLFSNESLGLVMTVNEKLAGGVIEIEETEIFYNNIYLLCSYISAYIISVLGGERRE